MTGAAATSVLRGPSSAFTDEALAGGWNRELPSTAIELILEFEGRWELDLAGDRVQVRAFAAGLIAGPVRSRADGPVRLVQIAIDPLAAPALLGVPAGELAGSAVDLTALLGREGDWLLERLAEGDGVGGAERWATETAQRVLAERGPLVPADLQRAVGLLRASGGGMSVEAVSGELGCSRRHLARRFQTWLGVSPSEFRRLVRFEGAIAALREDSGQPLGVIAHDCGYADQAHMNRDFRALAAASPGSVASRFH